MDQQKVLLILENSNAILESKSDSTGAVILEGVFAQFGVVNNNDRLYEENEYLPHLEYLKTKISSKRLMGELDHPDKFDISLQKVSHIIESLDYDNATRTVRGRVRLLDTDPGRQAKKLIEAGVPLSISSRAAGVVGSDKRVKLKKIFTYDLVADPGFENATLSLVNESLGFSGKSNVQIYDVSEMYDSELPFLSNETKGKQTQNKSDNMSQNNQNTGMISERDFNEYSKHVKKEIELLEKKIQVLTKKSLGSEKTISKLSEYSNYLAQKLNGAIKYSNYLSENVDKTISESKKARRDMNDITEYTNYLANRFNVSIEYQNYLAENLDKSISFSNYLSNKINQTIDYSNYIAENFDKAIDYSNYLSENLNNSIRYQEYLGENLDNAIKHNDYLAENLNSNIGYSNYLAEQLDKSIGYGDYIAESINVKEKKKTKKIMEKRAAMIGGRNLSEKVDHMISEAKKEKASVMNESSKFPFLRYLSPEKRSKFVQLKQTEKEIVSEALSTAIVFSEKDVVNVWESALAADRERRNLPKWIAEMPTEYAPIWESMSNDGRKRIAAAAQYIKLDTPYQIRNFWASRPEIANFDGSSVQTLNESANPYSVLENVNSGNSEYRDAVRKALKGKI
jgi:hypothetical protein